MKPAARAFLLSLEVAARLVRSRVVRTPASALLGFVGATVARRRRITRAGDAQAMAEAWQRAFPSKKQVPIVGVDDATGTAFAEIHTPCPLRGSGDVDACYRMMAYDRAFAARAGAELIVLTSQATPGVSTCRVALRAVGAPIDDLVPASALHAKRRRTSASRSARD